MSSTKLKHIPHILMLVASLTLTGLGELFRADFSVSIFKDWGFWFRYSTVVVANIVAFYSIMYIRTSHLEHTKYLAEGSRPVDYDPNYLGNLVSDARFKLNQLITQYRSSRLPQYLGKLNRLEKIAVYKYNKINKINKLYNKTKPNMKKIEKLEKQITDEYIDNNINNLKVKYVMITESYITSGTNYSNLRGGTRTKLHSKGATTLFDNWMKWAASMVYMLLLTSIALELTMNFSAPVMVSVAFKVVGVLWSAIQGMLYAYSLVEKKVLFELNDRINIMENFVIEGEEHYG